MSEAVISFRLKARQGGGGRERILSAYRPRTFELLYALAYAGVFIGFIPFFSLFLPIKVQTVAPDHKVALLSLITVSGVTTASLTNILFGSLSDRTHSRSGTRRPWIAAGLASLMVGYALVHLSRTPVQLFLAEAYFQMSLNMLFGPLLAVMADEIPNERKGTVAGLMGTAHPFASLSGIVFTLPAVGNEARQFALVGLATSIMIIPFLVWARESGAGVAGREQVERPRLAQRDLILAWSARFLVQAAGTAAVTYLFYYFQGILRGDGVTQLGDQTGRIARTIAMGTFLSAPLTLAAGYVSDRIRGRKPLLGTFSILMVAGLLGMAAARDWIPAQLSYLLFIVAYSGFLMLLAAFTMQILPSPRHHGRDLGIINLTNTIPAMLAPALALPMFAKDMNFAALLLVVALLTAVGGTLTLLIRGQR